MHTARRHSDKSYVTLEQRVCPVCATPHDTGALLLDTRLRDRFADKTTTGWALCPAHQKLYDDGYIALVGCDPARSGNGRDAIAPEDAWRTGKLCHLRFAVFEQVFSGPLPRRADGRPLALVFCDDEVIDMLALRGAEAAA